MSQKTFFFVCKFWIMYLKKIQKKCWNKKKLSLAFYRGGTTIIIPPWLERIFIIKVKVKSQKHNIIVMVLYGIISTGVKFCKTIFICFWSKGYVTSIILPFSSDLLLFRTAESTTSSCRTYRLMFGIIKFYCVWNIWFM